VTGTAGTAVPHLLAALPRCGDFFFSGNAGYQACWKNKISQTCHADVRAVGVRLRLFFRAAHPPCFRRVEMPLT
jgi:hypothetical protein